MKHDTIESCRDTAARATPPDEIHEENLQYHGRLLVRRATLHHRKNGDTLRGSLPRIKDGGVGK